jgi:hypothetical protein
LTVAAFGVCRLLPAPAACATHTPPAPVQTPPPPTPLHPNPNPTPRGPAILAMVDKWVQEADGDTAHRNQLTELRGQLAAEFAKLRP